MVEILSVKDIFEIDFKKPLFSLDIKFKKDQTRLEAQFFNLLLWCMQNLDSIDGVYLLKKSLCRRWVGWDKSKNSSYIYDTLSEIVANPAQWNIKNRDKTVDPAQWNTTKKGNIVKYGIKRGTSSLITDVFEFDSEYFGFSVNKKFEVAVKNPKIYIGMNLLVFAALNFMNANKYSYQMYSLLVWQRFLGNKNPIISIEEIRDCLLIPDENYKEFKIFKRDVLNPIVKALNKAGDVNVRIISTIRAGRKIEAIKFETNSKPFQLPLFTDDKLLSELREMQTGQNCLVVSNKGQDEILTNDKPKKLTISDTPNINPALHDKLIAHGIQPPQIQDFINNPEIGEQGIQEGFDYYKKNLDAGKIHTNKPAYLSNAILKKWGAKTQEQKEENQKKDQKEEIIIKMNRWKDIVKNKEQEKHPTELQELEEVIELYFKGLNRQDYKSWRNFI